MALLVLAGCRPGTETARRATPARPPAAPATTAPPPPTTTPEPPYPVATSTVALVDRSRRTVSRGRVVAPERSLTTVVWSPQVGGQRWPLVVFAAGFRVGPDVYRQLCAAWAAAGYVVAAPEFPLADAAVAGAALDEGDLDNEPADVDFVIASLLASTSPIASAIDPARIAVAGHSDGAEVALAVGQQAAPTIKAVIALSGQPVVPPRGPDPPLLVVQGDRDAINPPARAAAVYQQAGGPRFLLSLLGAGHLSPFVAGSAWLPVVEAVSVDFWDHYLAGTTGTDDRLRSDATRPGLSSLR